MNEQATPRAALWGKIDRIDQGVVYGRISDEAVFYCAINGHVVGEAKPQFEKRGAGGTFPFEYDLCDVAPFVFLADELNIEIRSDPADGAVLDSQRVPAERFIRPQVRTFPRGAMQGVVDECANGVVRGWVWNPSAPTHSPRH